MFSLQIKKLGCVSSGFAEELWDLRVVCRVDPEMPLAEYSPDVWKCNWYILAFAFVNHPLAGKFFFFWS